MSGPGLVFQHDDDAPPALLAEWLERREIPSRHVHVDREGLPELGDAPWVVVLGSHHSVNQSEPGWIPAEQELIREAKIPPGPWLNFHTEGFTVPEGTQLLARSAAGPAAFRRGPHLGVQFHPEATPEIA